MSDLPAPLVPAEVDLRAYPYIPIFRTRLFASDFHAGATDAEWRAGVTLWLKSWDQVPAGTLPNDDTALCRIAEFGHNARAWRKVREMALRGWFLCNDGRLHHRVVAEGVLQAWSGKVSAKTKGKAGAAKRWNKNNDDGLVEPSRNYSRTNARANGHANASAMPGPMPGDSNREGEGDRDKKEALTRARALEIVACFERCRVDIFGASLKRPGPHATDMVFAERWVVLGCTEELARSIFAATMQRRKTAGQPPIDSLKYFDAQIREALQGSVSRANGIGPDAELSDDDRKFMETGGWKPGTFEGQTKIWAHRVLGYYDRGSWREMWGQPPDSVEGNASIPSEVVEFFRGRTRPSPVPEKISA